LSKYPTIELNYKADLEIDQHQLELEWLAIAKQIMAYSEVFAQAIYDRNRAKEALDVTKADLDTGIRQAAAAANEKITEAVVSNRMQTKPTHIEALQNLHKADYVVDLLRGAIAAFQAKKSALENLVRLFGMKYYAEPYEEPGSDTKPIAMEQGKRAGVEALKKEMPPAKVHVETKGEVTQVTTITPPGEIGINDASKPSGLPPRPSMRPLPRKP